MRASSVEIDLLLSSQAVLARRNHPELATALDRSIRGGRLLALLPGVYARPIDSDNFEVRARALQLWEPNAVFCGRAAAKLTFWPKIVAGQVEAAAPSRRARPRGMVITRRRVPPELVTTVQGIRCTSPALTALDLCAALGGNAIDTVLRTRAATLAQLHEALALTPGRAGNVDRRALLLDSRDEPWSEAERETHRLLRAAGIKGWEANYPLEMLSGIYWIDVAFPDLKLAIEIDGREFHNTPEAFESDRWRQNNVVLAGWRVLRFTANMVHDQPQIVMATIERALAA